MPLGRGGLSADASFGRGVGANRLTIKDYNWHTDAARLHTPLPAEARRSA